MLSTIQSQKIILTEEENAYFANTSEEEIENIKECLVRARKNISTVDSDGTSGEQYKGLHERQCTYWPTFNDPEKDTIQRIGSRHFAEKMSKHITDKNAFLIDIGGGTGYLAAAVKEYGFVNIDCMEPSQNMVDNQPEGLYKKIFRDVINSSRPSEIDTGAYDCAMLYGVTNTGHLEVEDFPELLRVIKPGGFLVFTLSDYWSKLKDYGLRLDAFLQENLEKGNLASVVKERIVYLFHFEDSNLYVVKKEQ